MKPAQIELAQQAYVGRFIDGERTGTGDGATAAFSRNLAWPRPQATTVVVKLDGVTLQWHHNGKRFTAAANPGFDMNLAGYTIEAGKTFVICRNQKPSEALKSGTCDITNDSKGLNGQGKNAVAHNGDDAIEMFYNGKVIDVIGKVGEAVKCWKDANNTCLTKDVTIHRRASVRVGSTTFRPIEWDLSKKDYVANLGIHM